METPTLAVLFAVLVVSSRIEARSSPLARAGSSQPGSHVKTDANLRTLYPDVVASLAAYEASQAVFVEPRVPEGICYEHLGCFMRGGNFSHFGNRLPRAPEELQTQFLLYNGAEQLFPEYLDYEDPSTVTHSGFEAGAPTVFIMHGFGESGHADWIKEYQTAVFRKYPTANFISVNWAIGAGQPDYWQAACNTRVIGAQIARMITVLNSHKGTPPSMVHLIGFSLGAHIAGLTSQKLVEFGLTRVGRISGLDPAGPVFEGAHPIGRLDESDADFVQAVHGNGGTMLQASFGIVQRVGHRDYYPNGGQYQPGCPEGLWGSIGGVLGDISDAAGTVACNHFRALAYAVEATSSPCRFTSLPCESYAKYISGACLSRPPVDLDIFTEDPEPSAQSLYFMTNAEAGYCTNPLKVSVSLVDNRSPDRKGALSLNFKGNSRNSVVRNILKETTFRSGKTYQEIIPSRMQLEDLSSATLEYQRSCMLLGCRGNTHLDVRSFEVREVEGNHHRVCSLRLPYSQIVVLPLTSQVCAI